VTPEHGSLVATGVEPTVIRVTVTKKATKPTATKPVAPEATAAPSAEPDPAVAGGPAKTTVATKPASSSSDAAE
jgi:hypothetical protein